MLASVSAFGFLTRMGASAAAHCGASGAGSGGVESARTCTIAATDGAGSRAAFVPCSMHATLKGAARNPSAVPRFRPHIVASVAPPNAFAERSPRLLLILVGYMSAQPPTHAAPDRPSVAAVDDRA